MVGRFVKGKQALGWSHQAGEMSRYSYHTLEVMGRQLIATSCTVRAGKVLEYGGCRSGRGLEVCVRGEERGEGKGKGWEIEGRGGEGKDWGSWERRGTRGW